MRKITAADLLDLTSYEKKRREIRRRLMDIKNLRRLHVGPYVTYLFETYDTMWYQVQEMTRAERIVDEAGIQGELNAYNELIPEKNQLSASLFIEISDVEERKNFLSKIVTLPAHTYLSVAGEKINAEFDPRQGSEDKLSSVQYVKFTLTEQQSEKFGQDDSEVILGFDHPHYSHNYQLRDEEKATLYQDLSSD